MIHPLTSLRFAFALLVFGSHLSNSQGSWVYTAFLENGFAGVGFFFMLSGFVLHWSCREQAMGQFYRNRIARIYPTHLLTLLLFLLPALLKGSPPGEAPALLSNALLLHAFVPDEAFFFSGNPVSWSISVEFFFYALFPLLLMGKGRLRRVLLLLIVLAMIAGAFLLPQEQQHALYYISPLMRLPEFIIGMELSALFQRKQKIQDTTRQYSGWQWLALAAFIISYALANYIPLLYRYGMYYWLPVGCLIYAFALPGFWHRLLSQRWLRWLGEISFAFYMIHLLVIRVVMKLGLSTFVESLLALALSIAAAAAIRHFYEQPLNRLIRKNG